MKNKLIIIFFTVIVAISLYLAITMSKKEGYQVGTGIISICNKDDGDYSNTNICHDIGYINPETSTITNVKARIEPNYYIDSNKMLQKVPYGYVASADKTSYVPSTKSALYEEKSNKLANDEIDKKIAALQQMNDYTYSSGNDIKMFSSRDAEIASLKKQKMNADKTSNTAYNSNNYDITYHADTTINEDENTAGVGKMWVKDAKGTLTSIPYSDVKNTTLYYETGSYPFGPSSYVPNYEESTLLSKSSNPLQKTKNTYDSASQKAGFCEATKSSIIEREQKCNDIDHNLCASTNCCVLLGGEKCVAGNENGPVIKANYSDFLIVNRDYYYYKGKCYGNCS